MTATQDAATPAATALPATTTPPASQAEAPIVTRALTRMYGTMTAADSLDLEVRSGEIFGLLGPNGAGKSTTIKMLITLLPPTRGTATVAGADIVREPGLVRRRIGYVPQLVSADGALTARENLRVSARLYHIERAGRETAIEQELEFMGLADVADKMVRTYSGRDGPPPRAGPGHAPSAPPSCSSMSRRSDSTRSPVPRCGSASPASASATGRRSC